MIHGLLFKSEPCQGARGRSTVNFDLLQIAAVVGLEQRLGMNCLLVSITHPYIYVKQQSEGKG
jgi:hypothetical protein